MSTCDRCADDEALLVARWFEADTGWHEEHVCGRCWPETVPGRAARKREIEEERAERWHDERIEREKRA